MKTSINDPRPAWAAGNGSLLLVCGADGVLTLSRYGTAALTLRPIAGGCDCEIKREGNALVLHDYGLPPSPDPAVSRSSVILSITCHDRRSAITLDILAAHDLVFSLSSADGIYCGRSGGQRFRTGFGLLGIPEGHTFLNEDEGTLTFTTGNSRLTLRLDAECAASQRPWGRRNYFRRFLTEASDTQEVAHREELYARQSAAGGFCLGEGPTPLTEQCKAVSYLAEAGNRLPCDAFFRYVATLLTASRHLPYAATADGCEILPSRRDGEAEFSLLIAMKAYVGRLGLSGNDTIPTLAGRMAEELLAAYRGKTISQAIREALVFALSICRDHTPRGQRFRIAAALDAAPDTAVSP